MLPPSLCLSFRYARTIAIYRRSGLSAFIPQIDALIKNYPDNPYFYELKGQFLFESGESRRAIPPLRKATKLAPNEPLIRILFAQALLAETQNSGKTSKATLDKIIAHLRRALVKERCSAKGYRQLATAYGMKKNTAQARLASAFAYQYEGKSELAKRQAEDAKKTFSPGSANWLKADDILKLKPSGC